MTWRSITESEMEELLQISVLELSPSALLKFERLRIPITPRCCRRADTDGYVFAVARSSKATLIFDDVEEEFAISEQVDLPVLEIWDLLGPLEAAVQNLDE